MRKRSPRVLVFQHIAVEHPGIFREFLAADGGEYLAVELDAGEAIPPLEDFDALWVMGGPMDVWQEDIHPWLRAEKRAIARAVSDLAMPYLGFCLGHQLLAAALGGEVGLAAAPEVGIMPVMQTAAGLRGPYLRGLPAEFPVLQWHSAEIARPPGDAGILAASPLCAVQAMSVGDKAFSMQFHVEIVASTVADWNAIPEYREALQGTLGSDGAASLAAVAEARAPAFNDYARRIYENWKQATGFAP